MNKLGTFLSFTLGAAIGSFVSWQILKNKYKQISDQEIADVKARYVEIYGDKEENQTPEFPESELAEKIKDAKEYAAILATEKYVNYSDVKEPEVNTAKPYMVDATDYSDDFDLVTLTYYNDGILADENDDIIEDLENTVGVDFAKYFEDGLDDSVYIRNDISKLEYEILRDERNFTDVKKSSSPR